MRKIILDGLRRDCRDSEHFVLSDSTEQRRKPMGPLIQESYDFYRRWAARQGATFEEIDKGWNEIKKTFLANATQLTRRKVAEKKYNCLPSAAKSDRSLITYALTSNGSQASSSSSMKDRRVDTAPARKGTATFGGRDHRLLSSPSPVLGRRADTEFARTGSTTSQGDVSASSSAGARRRVANGSVRGVSRVLATSAEQVSSSSSSTADEVLEDFEDVTLEGFTFE